MAETAPIASGARAVPDDVIADLRRIVTKRHRDELARVGPKIDSGHAAAAGAACIVGVLATLWSFSRHLPLLITDSQSHLSIARRLLDGSNRGPQQLGTVWLPLPHLLLAPFSAPLGWWRSGFGAALLGTICLAATSVALFGVTARITRQRLAGLATVSVLLSTAPILYIHTTAMTEPVLIAAVSMLIAGVVGWEAKGWSYSGGEIATFCGVPAFLVVLSRYEGWALVGVVGLYAGASIWRWKGFRKAARAMVYFAAAPLAAVMLWLLYNATFFGDALAFQRGAGSSEAQMAARLAVGGLPDHHNIRGSLATYDWVVRSMCGPVLWVLVLIVSLLYFAGVGPRMRSRAPFALLSLGAFHVFSLWAGQTFISRDYAVRYGAVMIPFIALMTGWAAHVISIPIGSSWASFAAKRGKAISTRSSAIVAVLVLFSTSIVVVQTRTASTKGILGQGRIEQQVTRDIDVAARWVHRHHDGRAVLIDEIANPSLISLGLDLDQVVASYSGSPWQTAMAGHGGRVARWALIDRAKPSDRVAGALRRDPRGWHRAFRSASAEVYRFDPTTNIDETSDTAIAFGAKR